VALAEMHIRTGQVDVGIEVLRGIAHNYPYAAYRSAALLAERGSVHEAIEILRVYDDGATVLQVAANLFERGFVDEAMAVLGAETPRAPMPSELVRQVAGSGRTQQAIDILRARADLADRSAEVALAVLLYERGDHQEAIDILGACADAGDSAATLVLAGIRQHHHTARPENPPGQRDHDS
jgi:tetratricopeptide (TPR) repeat protein